MTYSNRGRALLTQIRTEHVYRHAGVLVALVIVLVAGSIGSDVFLTSGNFTILAGQVAGIGVIAAGTTILMILGGLDLSIGASVGVASICIATWLNDGMGSVTVVVLVLCLTTAFGLIQGLVITVTKANALIVTLGGMSILQGLAQYLTPNGAVPILGGFTTLGIDRIGGGLPVGFLVMVGVLVLSYLLLHRLRVGRVAFAIGNNPDAARLAGLRVDLTQVLVYAFNGCLVGLGACILTSAVGTGGADVGVNLALQMVAAVVIGGASLAGGQGSIFGTLLGVLLIGMLTNALNLIGVGSYLQFVAFGAIVIFSVALRSSAWSPRALMRRRRQQRLSPGEAADPEPASVSAADLGPEPVNSHAPAMVQRSERPAHSG